MVHLLLHIGDAGIVVLTVTQVAEMVEDTMCELLANTRTTLKLLAVICIHSNIIAEHGKIFVHGAFSTILHMFHGRSVQSLL